MKLIHRGIITSLLILLSHNAFACYPAKISLENRSINAQNIYVGIVEEVQVNKKENQAIEMISTTEQITPYSLSIKVIQSLKGINEASYIKAKVVNCGSGKADLSDKVIVFYSDNTWFTQVFNQADFLKLQQLNKL